MTLAVNLAQGASNNVTFRNRIINGGMVFDQRNAGAVVTATGVYALDRYIPHENTDGAYTVQQVTTAPAGFSYSMKATVTTADTSIGASQNALISQYIEGYNVSDLGWGTANAQTVTLSFWVNSAVTGTFSGSLQNSASDRSYPFSYTINSANTWEYETITITGDTTGTWLTTNNVGLRVWFALSAGSSLVTTAGAWAAGTYYGATGQANWMATIGNTFYITGVQLEAGTTASPFEYRQYGTELALCQRYFWKIGGTVTEEQICMGLVDGGSNVSCITSLPVAMRTAPSVGYSSASAFLINDAAVQIATTAVAIYKPALQTIGIVVTVASGLTLGRAARFFIGNSLSAYINFSAEL